MKTTVALDRLQAEETEAGRALEAVHHIYREACRNLAKAKRDYTKVRTVLLQTKAKLRGDGT